jgi:hypothetical protein
MRSQRSFVPFQIGDEVTRLNAATQSAIGNAVARLLDTSHEDNEADSRSTIKEVFAVSRSRDKYSRINGAPIDRLVDENMRKERAMLAQVDTKVQVPWVDRNCKSGKSDGSDEQTAKTRS